MYAHVCFKLGKEANMEGSEYTRIVTLCVHLVRKGHVTHKTL